MIKFLMVLTVWAVGTVSLAQTQQSGTADAATQDQRDHFKTEDALQEVVVTGTRNAVDVRHLPMTVTVINRDVLVRQHQPSVLPTVMQQVPGLMVTSRSMMGYGVSGGAAGSTL